MSQVRNRWIVNIVLGVAVLAFVGVSMVPLLAAFNNAPHSTESSTTAKNDLSPSEQKSKLEDTARGYEQVLQREPEDQAALSGLLQTRLQLLSLGVGDVKGVIEPLEKLTKLNPQKTEYAVLLAQAKEQIGDNEGAAAAYRSVLQNKPGDSKALQGMVVLLVRQKRPEAAIGLLQETLSKAASINKVQPGSVDVNEIHILLGNVYVQEKRYDQALVSYDMAIKNNPQDFRPVLTKAILLQKQGRTEEAKPLFSTAANLAPAEYKDKINQLATISPVPTPSPTATP